MKLFWAGVIIVFAIFAVAFRITSERNPPPFSDITTCPNCENGKIWDQAHGSSDLELINCPRCGGSGEIPFRS